MPTKKNYWRIVGYQATRKIFETEIPWGFFTDREIRNVLRVLVAKASLTHDEILDSYVRRNTKRYRSLLEVQVHGKQILPDVWDESSFCRVRHKEVNGNGAARWDAVQSSFVDDPKNKLSGTGTNWLPRL